MNPPAPRLYRRRTRPRAASTVSLWRAVCVLLQARQPLLPCFEVLGTRFGARRPWPSGQQHLRVCVWPPFRTASWLFCEAVPQRRLLGRLSHGTSFLCSPQWDPDGASPTKARSTSRCTPCVLVAPFASTSLTVKWPDSLGTSRRIRPARQVWLLA